jgi:hypothetical protein
LFFFCRQRQIHISSENDDEEGSGLEKVCASPYLKVLNRLASHSTCEIHNFAFLPLRQRCGFFFDFGIFNDAKVHGCCAPEGAVDVLLGFQLLLWELVYLKTLLSNVYCPLLQKGDRTRQHFFVRKNAIADIRMVFNYFLSDIVKVFPNVKYKKNNESKE